MTTQTPLKVAIVGCGKIADGHMEAIRLLPGACVAAVCDLEELMAEQLAERFGVSAHYADFGRMLAAERPDVVHVTTPPQSHLALAIQAIDAGCHVFVEKPFAMSAGDAARLIKYAEASGRKITTGWTYYFDPVMVRARELITSGAIGEPVHIDAVYGYNLKGQFGSAVLSDPDHWVRSLPGGLFHNVIDHLLCNVIEFFPENNYRVQAQDLHRLPEAGDLDDELRISLSGRRATAHAVFSSSARPVRQLLSLFGTKDSLLVDFSSRTLTRPPAPALPGSLGRVLVGFQQVRQSWKEATGNFSAFRRSEFHFFAGLTRLLEKFYESIRSGTEAPIPYSEILSVCRVMDTVFDQTLSRGPVTR